MRRTILNITRETKERFEQMKKDYSDNPEEKDNEFINELLDYVEENATEEE